MSWNNVPCHPNVRKIVTRAIQRGHFGRTSLVYGPPGAGQGDVGRAIAMTMICTSAQDDFCGVCPACQRISEGIYPDVIEMHTWEDWSDDKDKEKQGKRKQRKKNQYSVGHMRAVQEHAMHLPYEGDLKFYIIHDAHSMNVSASNSLLKVLEEPHPHVRFILLTEQPAGILPTIRSRCWAVRLMPLEIESLAQTLQSELPFEQAMTVAKAAGGLPEQAKDLLADGYLERRDWLFDMLLRVKKRESAVAETADEIVKSKEDTLKILHALLRIVRDGLVIVSGGDPSSYENPDRSSDLMTLWRGSEDLRVIEGMKKILQAAEDQERFVNPTLLWLDLIIHLRRAM